MARAHYFHSYTFEFQEFITGHHVYKDVWTPFHGEKLSCESQPDNFYDKYAVKVVKNTETVGHVTRAISPYNNLNFGKRLKSYSQSDLQPTKSKRKLTGSPWIIQNYKPIYSNRKSAFND